ncbi:MAG TPA: bifunctional YncE family protein/alkaline phosphatase family protein [Chitinophagaceae bacterium]|nr:bifunctional YncE family protein/alkaline phosphatase family protein [Chitinophagaceae bacterium]
MKNTLFLSVWLLAAISTQSQDLTALESKRVNLPNGWSLTPAGSSLPLGDLPLNIAVSSTRHYAAVTNNGQSTQTIQLIDARSNQQLDQVVIPKSWGGIVFSADEKYLYASGGNDNWILQYAIQNNKLITKDTFKLGARWPKESISPTGITLDDKKHVMYVVTKENNSLYVIDLPAHRILRQLPLGSEAYTCLLSPDKTELYISLWGADKVMVFNTNSHTLTDSIPVGDNPNDLCISKNGRYLYVANANDNSVSKIDIRARKVLETLNAALYPTQLSGSTSNSVALSDDSKTLYIANADNNCLAVFDVSSPGTSISRGFIPTGWYPTSVRVIDKKLYVANGKGFSSFPNPEGPNPYAKKEHVLIHQGDSSQPKTVQYIGGGLLMGTMSIIAVPSEQQLSVYSQAVYHNTPYNKGEELNAAGIAGNPVPTKVGNPSPVKHVFYIIKENRTYDQVLGDMKEGNGDTSLVLFGENITPNQHAIARDFVLLDNFYVDGEVSADGHNWSMGAYATDFMEKNWPTSYGGRGVGAKGPTALNKKYIWDQASQAGVSFRTYGEFATRKTASIPVLEGHYANTFDGFNLHIMDTLRYRAWEKDFDSLLTNHELPQLMTIRFGNDHTEGMAAGRPTPFAHVADNDLAIGMFMEHLSKSAVWKESVVFILEDDAQNGPDHVDAHRSPAYIAGGYVKRHFVDHTMYTTSSMIHTIELILGMPPMTQYDAAATPMWRCFNNQPDITAYTTLPSRVNLNDVNPRGTKLAAMSKGLDFSKEDVVPDQVMNVLTWKAVKGENAVMPTPVRAAFFKPLKKSDDDD